MTWLLLAHVVAAVGAPWLVRLLGRRAFLVLAAAPAATAVWALTQTAAAHSATPPLQSWTWIPSLSLELSFVLDPLAWLMCLVVGGVGAAVLVYCASYFDSDEPGLGRFAGCLTAFAGAMLGLVGTDDLLVLFVFWEATTVLSFLLIGHRPETRTARSAATEALVVTTFGGLAMLLGIVLLGETAGTYQLSEILADPPRGPVVEAAVVLLLVGALSKSAQVPFHFWLPGAMAAPTPVSAYLHAAAMVKAGIYLLARLAPGFADTSVWAPVVLSVGGLTMLIGAWRALRQHDLKLLLAYGTVSQLGFLTVVAGAGSYNGGLTALTLLLAHALFKACLFLVVGTIDHSTDTRDLRELSGLWRRMPVLLVASVLAAASMAGVPPLLGFVSKEMAYDTFLTRAETGGGWDWVVLGVLVAGSVLTFAYSARFVRGAFGTREGVDPTPVLHPPGGPTVVVPALLAAASLLAGPVSTRIEPYLVGYAETMPAEEHAVHLGLWHGLSPALGLSALTIVLGVLLVLVRGPLERAQQRVPRVPAAETGYRVIMRTLDRVSLEVTGAVQRGSLPLSLGLILGTLVVLVGTTLVLGGVTWPSEVVWWASPADIGIAVVAVVAAVAAVRSRRRLRGVFLVGVTGYATALIFLLHGAPDLALTQVLVETISLVVLVLVLRRFGGRFNDDPSRRQRVVRTVMGVAVGTTVTLVALSASAVRRHPPASEGMDVSAVDFGGGYNIVNVILVDARAWDTMGELSVVLVAATGIASLVYVRGSEVHEHNERLRQARARRRSHPRATSWLAAGDRVPAERRSVALEVVTRLVFHTMVVWSVYLLLSGHNLPGGGFAAGLVAGLALTVRYLAGGRAELQAAMPVTPGLLLGTGLFLSAGFGFVSILFGGRVLQTWIFDVHVPLLGELHLVTSVVFDIGVYLVVVGLVLDVLRSLGGHLDVQIEEDQATRRGGRRARAEVTR
ncbi:Na+/H+ antiporter subunit A [Auraticoccus monumenti]|uniref:Multisubunit sodium/proton antiporter, MrpA subunit /multisubunit sodium/proton antiporter, MrpB subunit n=1 Tax=Auraticoccus monumenti TaxID=675864 RepID=A0A1G6VF63_9ACTN|nr:Na+/H+ antiporter subunit A [Auraticoccus monumenti]SDD52330.1 multisubunit sodium/proton antiporter, MrpA subunit /multisubunit sodium/proton antiporter, MrpB subunit [Auraticoccus monumenti]